MPVSSFKIIAVYHSEVCEGSARTLSPHLPTLFEEVLYFELEATTEPCQCIGAGINLNFGDIS